MANLTNFRLNLEWTKFNYVLTKNSTVLQGHKIYLSVAMSNNNLFFLLHQEKKESPKRKQHLVLCLSLSF